MKFIIRRASYAGPFDDEPLQPCHGAYSGNCEKTQWYIDIDTLEQLIELVHDNGRVVLQGATIMIYDDYLE